MEAKRFSCAVELIAEMLGTVPKNKEIYGKFIESKKPVTQKENESLTVDVEELELSGWTEFHKDDNGLFVYDYFVKGFFKHAGNVLKEQIGIKALRSKLDDFFFVSPRRIYLDKKEPDGVLERPIRMTTPKGPRVSLIKSDYVDAGTLIRFDIKLLNHKEIKPKTIENLLEYGELMGFGQWRNSGHGAFKVLEFKELTE